MNKRLIQENGFRKGAFKKALKFKEEKDVSLKEFKEDISFKKIKTPVKKKRKPKKKSLSIIGKLLNLAKKK